MTSMSTRWTIICAMCTRRSNPFRVGTGELWRLESAKNDQDMRVQYLRLRQIEEMFSECRPHMMRLVQYLKTYALLLQQRILILLDALDSMTTISNTACTSVVVERRSLSSRDESDRRAAAEFEGAHGEYPLRGYASGHHQRVDGVASVHVGLHQHWLARDGDSPAVWMCGESDS